MKNVRYDGTADEASLEYGGKTYRFSGPGAVVEMNNDHADEATKDPRFSLASEELPDRPDEEEEPAELSGPIELGEDGPEE